MFFSALLPRDPKGLFRIAIPRGSMGTPKRVFEKSHTGRSGLAHCPDVNLLRRLAEIAALGFIRA